MNAHNKVAPGALFSVTTLLRSRTSAVLALALAALPLGGVAACGDSGGAKSANIPPGDMPSGETWTGVYFHPVYGFLHMMEQDTNVIGKWKRADQSKWGELSGTKVGNVLHFTWKEHTYGRVDPGSIAHGKGVFVYKMGKDNTAELDGQFGYDDSETGGGEWHNVKQQRMTPDLNSISGDMNGTAPPAAGKWDEK